MHGDACPVERDEDPLAQHAVDAEACDMGQAAGSLRLAEYCHAADLCRCLEDAPGRPRSLVDLACERAASGELLCGGAEADGSEHVLTSRSAGPFFGPPTSRGLNRTPLRTTRAPMPGGPPSLCELTETKSASSTDRSTGT